jgi:hypothetical protein
MFLCERGLTSVKDAVYDGQVERDQDEDGLLVEHMERPVDRSVKDPFRRPVLFLVFGIQMLIPFHIGFPKPSSLQTPRAMSTS